MFRRSACLCRSGNKLTADCVIIGSGIVGCSVALELARNKDFLSSSPNLKILVIDPNPKAGMGTTSWSSGIIRTFYTVKQSCRISWECFHIFKNWNDHLQLTGDGCSSAVKKTSYTPMREVKGWICRSKASERFLDQFEKIATEYDIPFQRLDLAETEKIAKQNGWDISKSYKPQQLDNPDFGAPVTDDKIVGSIVVPQTGYVADPMFATTNIYDACLQASGRVQFKFGSRVVKIGRERAAGGSNGNNDVRVNSVTLANGDVIETPRIINCAGTYSSVVQKMVYPLASTSTPTTTTATNADANGPFVKDDTTLTCRPLRAECVIVDGPEGLDCEKDGVVSFDCETGFYVKPEGRNRVLVGGLDLNGDKFEYISTDDLPKTELGGEEHGPGDQAYLHLCRYALRVPSARIPSSRSQLRGYVSSYDVSDDWTPIVDATNVQGLYTAVGTSGNCFKTAPVLGKMMSKIVVATENKRSGIDRAEDAYLEMPLGGTKDNKLALDAYNRKRHAFNIFGGVIG